LPDTDCCAWHAAPGETDHKSIETLRDARVPAEIRGESKARESLDGAVLAGMELEDELEFKRALLRYANISKVNLKGADLSKVDLYNADLSEAFLQDADLSEAFLRDADLSGADLYDADLSEADLYDADLINADLYDADLLNADLRRADLSEVFLRGAELSGTLLWGADLSKADLLGADFSEKNLYDVNFLEANLRRADLSKADLGHTILTGANFAGAELSNLTVDRETTVDRLAEPEPVLPSLATQRGDSSPDESKNDPDSEASPNDWDRTARAYHDLKTEFHRNGFIGKPRRLHIGERRARRHETAVEEGWFSRQHLIQLVLGLFTGYGVGVWRLVRTMTALFLISTVTYALAGVADPLTYSTITFATSPPRPTNELPIWARFVANVETFVGTLLIVSLGFVLGNREQF
jgi:uncharacterized protein YjbI with pentapeptide repeats